jgi:hypothetical protein
MTERPISAGTLGDSQCSITGLTTTGRDEWRYGNVSMGKEYEHEYDERYEDAVNTANEALDVLTDTLREDGDDRMRRVEWMAEELGTLFPSRPDATTTGRDEK